LHCPTRQQRGDYTAKEQAGTYNARMIYFCDHMKIKSDSKVVALLTIFLVLSCAMFAFSIKPAAPNKTSSAVLFVQTTPTPPVEVDHSEVGSTDEIIFMGFVIVMIVLFPILLQRKAWVQKDNV